MTRRICRWGACLILVPLLLTPRAQASEPEDPLAQAKTLHELGVALLDAGLALRNTAKVREALGRLKDADALYRKAAARPGNSDGMKRRIAREQTQLEKDLAMARKVLDVGADRFHPDGAPPAEGPPTDGEGDRPEGGDAPGPGTSGLGPEEDGSSPEVHAPPLAPGEARSRWCQRVLALYRKTDAPSGRAHLARTLAKEAGPQSLTVLGRLFREEQDGTAREGIHEALATVGTQRVATLLRGLVTSRKRDLFPHVLDVIYRCLEKPEAEEPERPFVKVIRTFHKLRDRKLTLGILNDLDAMGTPGVAALGVVLYEPDFGYHDHTIGLLATKQDRRAVPPLVHKMNRFKFHYRVQMPAHKALLQLGWYAVPELINRLDNRAAGIWISWTLRKITGETMGTDKRKWSHWWLQEKVRHPELFEDEDERPTTPGR